MDNQYSFKAYRWRMQWRWYRETFVSNILLTHRQTTVVKCEMKESYEPIKCTAEAEVESDVAAPRPLWQISRQLIDWYRTL